MPEEVERCVEALMADPDFKPLEGRTKEESAWAVCQAKYKEKEKENVKTNSIQVPYKLKYNEEQGFSAIAIHAGLNKNYLYYDAENLQKVYKTQEGQSVTVGHDITGVGSVTRAEYNETGDEYGPFIDVRFVIQNNPQMEEAIKSGKITEVSTTTMYDKAWCTICNAEEDKCLHLPGEKYNGKIAGVKLNVTNFGPLALVHKGADMKSIIYNHFVASKIVQVQGLQDKLTELETKVNELQVPGAEPGKIEGVEPLKIKSTESTGKAVNVPTKHREKTIFDICGPPHGKLVPVRDRDKRGKKTYRIEKV